MPDRAFPPLRAAVVSVGYVALLVVAALGASAGCQRDPKAKPSAEPTSPPTAPTATTPLASEPVPTDATPRAPSAADIDAALHWLRPQLLRAVAAPDNPWALAHGVLAFGPELQTDSGQSAVDAMLSFAQRPAGAAGYAFPRERDGVPVEPHPYLILKDLLDAHVPVSRAATARDGKTVRVADLAEAMWKQAKVPQTDAEWYDAPWLLQAMLLTKPPAAMPNAAARLDSFRAAALARLIADDGPLRDSDAAPDAAFAPTTALGQAKRKRTHLYAHACGGFHLIQAVLQAVAAGGDSNQREQLGAELRLLQRRHAAERALYASMRAQVPALALELSTQELKFFGHLLETLTDPALKEAVGSTDPALLTTLDTLRSAVTADLVATLDRLRALDAYGNLDALRTQKPQLRLDLIGDGCHAVRGLTRVLLISPG